MIYGRFGNTTGRPYIEAYVVLPRLGVTGNVSFLADTGADRTTITPMDGTRLGLDYTKLGNAAQGVGIGGQSTQFKEQAIVAFVETGIRLCIYQIEILILEKPDPLTNPMLSAALGNVPSLLGRDIMQNWKFVYDAPHGILSAEVFKFDFDFPLPAPAPPPALPSGTTP